MRFRYWHCCCFKIPRMTRRRAARKTCNTITTIRISANVTVQPNVRTGNRKLKIQSVRCIAAKMPANACRHALRIISRRTGAASWRPGRKPKSLARMQCK